MATESVGTDIHVRPGLGRRRAFFAGPPVRLYWGAILGGVVTALAVWALLYAFGLAVGLSAVDPRSPGSLRASGIFTGIWSLVTPIVSLFVGGAVASRGADVTSRVAGALHGLVVWGLVTLAGAWLVTSLLTTVLSGIGMVAIAGSAALQGAGTPGGYAAQTGGGYGAQMDALGMNDVMAPVNQRLQAEGKPQVRPEQLEAATVIVIQEAARQGQLNKETLTTAITRNTALARADAEDVANRMVARFDDARLGAQTTALRAADATGKAFWGVFGVLFLSLLSALAGATVGVARRQSAPGSTTVTSPPAAFPHEPHEAHT
jgi:hypothetical protein